LSCFALRTLSGPWQRSLSVAPWLALAWQPQIFAGFNLESSFTFVDPFEQIP